MVSQEFARGHRRDAKLLRAAKIFHVMSDNMTTASRKSEFQKHVIVGVRQKWSSKKMNFLMVGLRGDVAKKGYRGRRSLPRRKVFGSAKNLVPFEINAKRDRQFEMW